MGSKLVVTDFSGGSLSCHRGFLLLRRVESALGFSRLVSSCFTDARDPGLAEHSVPELVRQLHLSMTLVYEDHNDHSNLRSDPLLAVAIGEEDVPGVKRRGDKDEGFASASPPILIHLELGPTFLSITARRMSIMRP